MTYSLIIPIYNEERTLPLLLSKLDLLNNNIEVIIIDDGSTDETKNILNAQGKFVTVRNNTNIGKGSSIRKGIELAKNKNVILIDGDLEVDVNDIPELIIKYENNNADALIGVRVTKNKNLNFDINSIGNYLINGFFNLLFKTNFNDVLCCVRILNLNLFKSLKIKSNRFSIEVETIAKLVLKNSNLKEAYIKYNRRTFAEGKKLKFYDGWNIIWTIIKLKFK
tara:strand:+ start:70 stop:738 length:669 start_codon:yes stop_codon:yes gene_type:complete